MFHRIRAIAAFFMRTYWLPVVIVILISATFFVEQTFSPIILKAFTSLWNASLNAYTGLATLIVALAVLYGEVLHDWKESLPNKLTVDFELDRKLVMRCRLADLANIGDARAFSQQIAKLMAKGEIDFIAPAVRITGGDVERSADGAWYRHYRVTIILQKMPDGLPDPVKSGEFCYLWEPPFLEKRVVSRDDATGARSPT